ncbi:MAG: hypothetical protein HRU40_20785, partial [Saprospiraceae bacterium]|nr:hypothetical protein [Saprospiraceae bacterium]
MNNTPVNGVSNVPYTAKKDFFALEIADDHPIFTSQAPKNTDSYTALPHKHAHQYAVKTLQQSGYTIKGYRLHYNQDCSYVCIYYMLEKEQDAPTKLLHSHIDFNRMFAIANSYNKTASFKAASG